MDLVEEDLPEPIPDDEITSGLVVGVDELPGPNAYEIIAFMSRANAATVGTQDLPDWFNVNTDLRTLISDTSTYSPTSLAQHSFQFHHDAVVTWDFWKHIKDETEFQKTY